MPTKLLAYLEGIYWWVGLGVPLFGGLIPFGFALLSGEIGAGALDPCPDKAPLVGSDSELEAPGAVLPLALNVTAETESP